MNNDCPRIDFDKSIFATTWINYQINEAMIDLREYTKGILYSTIGIDDASQILKIRKTWMKVHIWLTDRHNVIYVWSSIILV